MSHIATTYLTEIEKLMLNIKRDMAALDKKQSEYDKQISKIYHKIELEKFNACDGYLYAKRLKDVLQKRRLVKNESFRLNKVYHGLKLNGVTSRLPIAKAELFKSIENGREWDSKLDIVFTDIEGELK